MNKPKRYVEHSGRKELMRGLKKETIGHRKASAKAFEVM